MVDVQEIIEEQLQAIIDLIKDNIQGELVPDYGQEEPDYVILKELKKYFCAGQQISDYERKVLAEIANDDTNNLHVGFRDVLLSIKNR